MKPVILDVDTGLDDACAMLLAARHPDLELKAVTCVGGNVGLDQVVVNTLTVLEAAGRTEVPVARGAALPLLQPTQSAPHVHGLDGLGELDWPRSTRTTDARHAVELLRDVLLDAARTGELITLIPLAPMTNIAEQARVLIATGEKSAVFAGHLIEHRCQLYGAEPATIGDGGAVCAVIDPEGLTTKAFPLRIELSGSWSRGRTIVDTRDWSGDLTSDPHGAAPTVVRVATAVDGRRYADLWLRTVR